MADLLPVGRYVRVTDTAHDNTYVWVGRIVGYDMGDTKYRVAARYPGFGRWLFADGGVWAFPAQCVEISEAEAHALPQNVVEG